MAEAPSKSRGRDGATRVEAAPPVTPGDPAALLEIPKPAVFPWPPGRQQDEEPKPTPPPFETPFEQILRVWLGPVVLPWPRRAEIAGWRPDSPADRCPRCAGSVGPYEADAGGCPTCRTRRLPWRRAVRLGEYDGPLRQAVRELKFHRSRAVGGRLGRLLGESLAVELLRERVDPATVIVVPVPASYRRRLLRGVDHSLVLARGVREVLGGRLVRALGRRHRPEQWSVVPSQRAANVAGAFRVRRSLPGEGVIVLVDDIRTTGATLRAAARALRSHPENRESGGGGEPVRVRPDRLWVATVAVARGAGRRSPQRGGVGGR